ncbi:interactor protein for cytohesin exchange factors 1 isoform X2 [Tiliqua scincoides]|uniref:interactor protein for cytohesin exchange factors 1 isoform X2 n=1 Tax=Tiliqua scincoides TaxID=71010 RepID=UPI003461C8D7
MMTRCSSFGLSCFGICTMSRRRISCKDLGLADCQGWLYKKKEKGGFIGNKWKKFWCVLKGPSLYWYSNQLAEKAEGFLRLPDFTVDKATECKKKYAMKIIHPQIKTFYFAAENVDNMNMWLNKLNLAVQDKQVNKKNEEECYSESEHEDPEISVETPPPPYSDQPLPLHLDQQEPSLTSHVSSEVSCSLSLPESTMVSQGSSSSLSKVLCPERQSWHDLVNNSSCGLLVEKVDFQLSADSGDPQGTDCLLTDCNKTMEDDRAEPECGFQNSLSKDTSSVDNDPDNLAGSGKATLRTLPKEHGKRSEDEMEKLYKSLEQASLSPLGDRRPSTKKELRKSFIKRSKNPSMNEKLHKIRTLNSTLKCKEQDLARIDQLLGDHELTARKYREWKNINTMLIQEIYQQQNSLNETEGNIPESAVTLQPSFIESTI